MKASLTVLCPAFGHWYTHLLWSFRLYSIRICFAKGSRSSVFLCTIFKGKYAYTMCERDEYLAAVSQLGLYVMHALVTIDLK